MLDKFNQFYKFGTIVKQKAALYTLAIVFTIAGCNFLLGSDTVSIMHLLQALVVSFVVALLEYALFNHYGDLTPSELKRNIMIWTISANILAIGSSMLFDWYAQVPMWGIVLLIIILEVGLIALHYAIYIINKLDTRSLNANLKKFQNR